MTTKYTLHAVADNGYNCSCCRQTWADEGAPSLSTLEECAEHEANQLFKKYVSSHPEEFDESFVEVYSFGFGWKRVKIAAYDIVDSDLSEREINKQELSLYQELVETHKKDLIKQYRNDKLEKELKELENELVEKFTEQNIETMHKNIDAWENDIKCEREKWSIEGIEKQKRELLEKIKNSKEKII